ncbi:hypothetical protein [Maricaulis maris]|uniref:hypothetical protein n=1 Tax=Alphaproteobacteria TaxID=28211 RepID=UPI003A93AC6C
MITPLKLSENIEVMRVQLDAAARDLDRRRAQHEHRPDDQGAYVRFLEAALAFEKLRARLEALQLTGRNARLQRTLALAKSELARRVAQVEAFGRLSSIAPRPRVRRDGGPCVRDLFASEGRA